MFHYSANYKYNYFNNENQSEEEFSDLPSCLYAGKQITESYLTSLTQQHQTHGKSKKSHVYCVQKTTLNN